MAIYTINTTAEQEIVLGIASKAVGQTNDQVLDNIVTQSLATLEENQRQSFLGTIAANDGLETLEQLASDPPNPNVKIS